GGRAEAGRVRAHGGVEGGARARRREGPSLPRLHRPGGLRRDRGACAPRCGLPGLTRPRGRYPDWRGILESPPQHSATVVDTASARGIGRPASRSEEHTSELQSRFDLVCRLLLEKKNKKP